MIEFVEGVASVGLVAIALRVASALRKREHLPDGVISRRFLDGMGDFQCPECRGWVFRKEHMKKRCECDEFWEPHRHFECRCGLTGIVQAARGTSR